MHFKFPPHLSLYTGEGQKSMHFKITVQKNSLPYWTLHTGRRDTKVCSLKEKKRYGTLKMTGSEIAYSFTSVVCKLLIYIVLLIYVPILREQNERVMNNCKIILEISTHSK